MTDEVVKRIQPERNRGGVWVRIGDEEYRIAPLAFAALQELGDDVPKLREIQGGVPNGDQMGIVIRLITSALNRNYPKLKESDVREMIDLGNFGEVLNAVMAVAGFVRRTGEPGEMKASTGDPSTSP